MFPFLLLSFIFTVLSPLFYRTKNKPTTINHKEPSKKTTLPHFTSLPPHPASVAWLAKLVFTSSVQASVQAKKQGFKSSFLQPLFRSYSLEIRSTSHHHSEIRKFRSPFFQVLIPPVERKEKHKTCNPDRHTAQRGDRNALGGTMSAAACCAVPLKPNRWTCTVLF